MNEEMDALRAKLYATRLSIEAQRMFMPSKEALFTIASLKWREQDLIFKINRIMEAKVLASAAARAATI